MIMFSTGKSRICFLLVTLLSLPANAGEIFEFYNGARPLGMGGASVATVNDETALLLNPAGLGRLRDYYITVVDPELEIGEAAEQIAGTEILNMQDPQKLLDKLNANKGKYYSMRGQVFPSLVVPNFGVGVFAKKEIGGEVDEAGTAFNLNYRSDWAIVFGFNFRIWDGIIKLGANARIVNRVEIQNSAIDPTSTALTVDTLASEGVGVASDVGLIFTAPVAWLPTLAVVGRDMGNTTYTFKDGMFTSATTDPNHTEQSVDAGFAVNPILGKRLRSTITVEYRGVTTLSDEDDQMRRFHAGFELNYADALFLRAGMNQRYWTAGVELSMFNYQFQGATYGEEIGTAATPREDRRYVVKFAYRF